VTIEGPSKTRVSIPTFADLIAPARIILPSKATTSPGRPEVITLIKASGLVLPISPVTVPEPTNSSMPLVPVREFTFALIVLPSASTILVVGLDPEAKLMLPVPAVKPNVTLSLKLTTLLGPGPCRLIAARGLVAPIVPFTVAPPKKNSGPLALLAVELSIFPVIVIPLLKEAIVVGVAPALKIKPLVVLISPPK